MKVKQIIAAGTAIMVLTGTVLTVNLQAGEKAGEKLRDQGQLNATGETQGGGKCCQMKACAQGQAAKAKSMECKTGKDKMGMGKCTKDQAAPGSAPEAGHHH